MFDTIQLRSYLSLMIKNKSISGRYRTFELKFKHSSKYILQYEYSSRVYIIYCILLCLEFLEF